jgi:hypothetical protein
MAEGLTANELASEAPVPAPRPPGSPPIEPAPEPTAAIEPAREPETLVKPAPREWRPGPHAGRFLLAYAMLGLILGAAVITFAVVTRTDDSAPKIAWSEWKPTTDGSARVRQIAAHVASNYRLPSGDELVNVIPRTPQASDPPLTTVAIDRQALFSNEQQYKPYSLDDGLMYILCGTGTTCAIREGQPSRERHRMLRREALELALYTFHYVDGVDSVLTFLPPRATTTDTAQQQQQQQSNTALFFRKDDPLFTSLYKAPLAVTIPSKPPRQQVLPADEAKFIDQLTAPVMYSFSLQRTADGQNAIALLQPYYQSG